MNDRHNQASLVSVPSRGLMIIGGTGKYFKYILVTGVCTFMYT